MDLERKQEILDQVSAWLDQLEGEPLPEGLDPALVSEGDEPEPADLYSVVAASSMTGAAVREQGSELRRQQQELVEVTARLGGLEGSVRRLGEEVRSGNGADLESARAAGREEGLRDLLDLADRMGLAVDEARRAKQSLSRVAKWGQADSVIDRITREFEQLRARLFEIFARAGVREFECTGQPFDSALMRALDVRGEIPTGGAVTETVRSGFFHRDELLRPAEVRLNGSARHASTATNGRNGAAT